MQRDSVTVGIVSDTHFWLDSPNGFGQQLQQHTRHIQAVLLEELQAAQLDLAVHLGDITCGGGNFGMSAAEFDRTLDWYLEGLQQLPFPVHLLPGNHDAVLGQTYDEVSRALGLESGLGRTIELPEVGAQLELLHSQGHDADMINEALPWDPTYGYVQPEELARFEAALSSAGSRNVIVFTHQLLMEMSNANSPTASSKTTANRRSVLDILERHDKVRAVFQGHVHVYDVHPVGGVTFVVAPPIIVSPYAWLELRLSPTDATLQPHILPLPDWADQGAGNPWPVDWSPLHMPFPVVN